MSNIRENFEYNLFKENVRKTWKFQKIREYILWNPTKVFENKENFIIKT